MVTVIEEGLFLCSVSRDVTITSLRVIGVARVVPGDRRAGVSAWCRVRMWSLYPALRYVVVAQLPDDGVVADVRVLRITVRTLHRRHAGGDALLPVIRFLLTLDLVHALCIVLLTGGYV